MKILVIEDDTNLAQMLKLDLSPHFTVDVAYTGEDGEYQAFVNDYHAIILDLVLPDANGLEVCRTIRNHGIQTPVIVLTALYETAEKIALLNAGADDYVTKPFEADELVARIRALLRRPRHSFTSNMLAVADLRIDMDKAEVIRGGKLIKLTRKELHLLEYLARNAGRVVTREMLFEHIWESSDEKYTNLIDVYIKNIRNRIDKTHSKKLIKTVHGLGYKLEAETKSIARKERG